VDSHDFAFGTSSRSSRLLHGGLRYLAQGRIGLVREASHEKMTLARIAPHLAAPLPFIFPTYKGTPWVRWKLRIGVKLYDWLCGKSNLGKSEALDHEGVLRLLPGLGGENLTGAVRYFDGFTSDARLVLDTLRSAAAHGARLLNYFALSSAERRGNHCECALRGEAGEMTVRARVVVNAAGAWAQRFAESRVKLRLTKGVHLVIDRSRLALPGAVVMADGHRILFAIPWGQRVILGTSDTDYDGPIENPTCEPQDMEYVLGVVNRSFPDAAIGPNDVICAWAGLRPLIADPNGKPSDISRAHQILVDEATGWIDVAGGKLTTYRLMAEQTVDRAVDLLGRRRRDMPCRTAEERLLEQPEFSGVVPPDVCREAVEHFCRHEWARHLDDVMIRRAAWHQYHRDHASIAAEVAAWMAPILGWDAQQRTAELARYQRMTGGLAPTWEPPGTQPSSAAMNLCAT
jgi:glycerol-3-phosphate dehydrogenase